MYRSYQIRPDIIDTEPGASALCPFSPPSDFVGGGEEYTVLMRQRYKLDAPYLAGRIRCFQSGGPLEIVGPFAEQARTILTKLSTLRNDKKAG